ncbi:hypothetical protein NT07LI_2867a, partial [Listeria innocua FSL S4-378]
YLNLHYLLKELLPVFPDVSLYALTFQKKPLSHHFLY